VSDDQQIPLRPAIGRRGIFLCAYCLFRRERAAANSDDVPPAQPEERAGVKLPRKVSELRWKLVRRAKQEPKFRFCALNDRIYRFNVLTAAGHLVWSLSRTARVTFQVWSLCRLRNNLAAAADVVPDHVAVEVAASGKEDSPFGRFRQAIGELHVLARLRPTR
jgi:hypothetical protein